MLPNISWGQDKKFIYTTFDFSAHHSVSNIPPSAIPHSPSSVTPPSTSSTTASHTKSPIPLQEVDIKMFTEENVKCDIEEKNINIKTDLYDLNLPLFAGVDKNVCTKFFGDGILKIKLKKKEKDIWKNLCSEAADRKLLQIIKRDWSKWNVSTSSSESSEESSPEGNEEEKKVKKNKLKNKKEKREKERDDDDVLNNSVVLNIDITEKDTVPIENPPRLDLDNSSFIDYFKENLTCAQKMLTLINMWNVSTVEERGAFMKNMISLLTSDAMSEEMKKLSESVKGGETALRDLDASGYANKKVTYCASWVNVFADIDKEQKANILSILFGALTDEEKQIVLSTFF